MSEIYFGNEAPEDCLEQFFDGLSPEEALLAAEDMRLYGKAIVREIDGKRRRIAPRDWVL